VLVTRQVEAGRGEQVRRTQYVLLCNFLHDLSFCIAMLRIRSKSYPIVTSET
jgi:hypothetical protein